MTGDALALGLAMLGDAGAPACQDGVCLLPGEAAELAPTAREPHSPNPARLPLDRQDPG
jgi:hypothetical protein